MPAGELFVKRILLEHVSGFTIALIPLIYLAINPSFGQNQAAISILGSIMGLPNRFGITGVTIFTMTITKQDCPISSQPRSSSPL